MAQDKTLEQELEEFLPKKKENPRIPPYHEPKTRVPNSETKRAELDYVIDEFTEPPREFETTYAFKLFYDLKTGKSNAVMDDSYQESEKIICIPSNNSKIRFGVDTNKHYLHFSYRIEDKESEKIVSEFIQRLRA